MMRVEESAVMDTLVKKSPKTNEAADGSFANEMEKANGSAEPKPDKTEKPQKAEENSPAADGALSENSQTEAERPEDPIQAMDGLHTGNTVPVSAQNVIVGRTDENPKETPEMKGGVPVLPIKELWQEAKPEAKIEVNHGGQEPGISMPVQAGGEAAEFADRVMQEANALLKGRQEPIKSEQEAESAGLKPVKIEHKEVFAAADLDGKKGDSDTAGAKGTNQPGNGIAGQNVATAVISEDGRIQFQESRAEPAPLQQTQQKDSVLSQIVERVRTHVGKEKSEFFLQLKPEHLGGLSIMLSADDKGVVAKLTTANQDVQYMLQSDMNQLQAALREKGIHVVHMEVIYDQTANSTAKDNGGNDQRWGGNTGNSHGRVPENVESAAAFYDDMSYYDMLAEQGGSVEFSA